MPRRRSVNPLGMAFLDAMTCGLGAVVLLYMIINGSIQGRSDDLSADLQAEAARLETEVLTGHRNLVELRNTVEEVENERVLAQGLARRLLEMLRELEVELATFEETTLAQQESLNKLKSDISTLEEDTKRLSASLPDEETPGDKVRTFKGIGNRQYLTGLDVGGTHTVLLVDVSSSMLADTLVNVVLRRNLPDAQKARSDKWRQTVATVDWLTTQLPPRSQFQVLTFAENVEATVPGTETKWLDVNDREALDQAVKGLRSRTPAGGTNLHAAFSALRRLEPWPNNVILITDGLPTQGERATRKGTISARDRLKLFQQAIGALPNGVPINVILLPMEGDPMAASAFWKLAYSTRGSFINPAEDWP